MAIVGDELRVHGIAVLRVIDASVMPAVTSTNTNAQGRREGQDGGLATINLQFGCDIGSAKTKLLHPRGDPLHQAVRHAEKHLDLVCGEIDTAERCYASYEISFQWSHLI